MADAQSELKAACTKGASKTPASDGHDRGAAMADYEYWSSSMVYSISTQYVGAVAGTICMVSGQAEP
jgi:hypothetical protein